VRYRILLVEDEKPVAETIRLILSNCFSKAQIDNAQEARIDVCWSVEGARDLIETAATEYDAAILDFLLPLSDISNEKYFDETICELLARWAGRIIIFHISGFSTDPAITKHMNLKHPEYSLRGLLIPKGNGKTSWQEVLAERVRGALYSRFLRESIGALFGGVSVAEHRDYRRFGGRTRPVSTTSSIVHLTVDISRYWPFLDDSTKTLVEQHFRIDHTQTPVAVFFQRH
jgi:CheY-like chemotaxis protein